MIAYGDKLLNQNQDSVQSSLRKTQKKLKKLSNHEKLLLLELHRTRENIVHELSLLEEEEKETFGAKLQRVDSFGGSSIGGTTISSSTEFSQRISFRYLKPTTSAAQYAKEKRKLISDQSSISNSNTELQKPKTSIDMVPVLTTSALSKVNYRSVALNGPILPIFLLPPVAVSSNDPNASNQNRGSVEDKYAEDMRILIKTYNKCIPEAILRIIRTVSSAELSFMREHLDIREKDIQQFITVLTNKALMPTWNLWRLDTTNTTVYMSVKAQSMFASQCSEESDILSLSTVSTSIPNSRDQAMTAAQSPLYSRPTTSALSVTYTSNFIIVIRNISLLLCS